MGISIAVSVLRLQVGFRWRRIDGSRDRGACEACFVLGIPGDRQRPRPIHALRFDRIDRKSVRGSPQSDGALPSQTIP